MESEVNVKGVSLKELFKAYTETDVPTKNLEQLEENNIWKKVWANLDKIGNNLTNGGIQNKKAKSSLKKEVKYEQEPKEGKQRMSNSSKSDRVNKDISDKVI